MQMKKKSYLCQVERQVSDKIKFCNFKKYIR